MFTLLLHTPLLFQFYGLLALAHALLALLWLCFTFYHWKDLLRIQYYITLMVFIGLVEQITLYALYETLNRTGVILKSALIFALIVSCVKRTLARFLLLIVCIGSVIRQFIPLILSCSPHILLQPSLLCTNLLLTPILPFILLHFLFFPLRSFLLLYPFLLCKIFVFFSGILRSRSCIQLSLSFFLFTSASDFGLFDPYSFFLSLPLNFSSCPISFPYFTPFSLITAFPFNNSTSHSFAFFSRPSYHILLLLSLP